ncbi:hypothetical protein CHS0354_024777 [Potamilus streckersoni]|uniref:Uncharacterized protein n=1 Tax=Potamilus streckersoni TaxID=2493646 RepID=A0AAE0T1D2_9BIVA|nr:hypothetical protein CHS0354_024777 [Potamilus streckersoni]
MAALEANKSACNLVQVGNLTLENPGNHGHKYNRLLVLSPEMVMVVDCEAESLSLYNLKNGHIMAVYHTLKSILQDACICSIHDTDITIALCLLNHLIEILVIKTRGQTVTTTVIRTLNVRTEFDFCYGVKYRKENLLILGQRMDNILQYNLCCGIVPITGSNPGQVHNICKCEEVNWISLSLNPNDDNMVYITYWAPDEYRDDSGVYGYRNNTRKFVYRHNDLAHPTGMTVDRRGFIFICNMGPDCIFQLTEKGQLVTILKEGIPSRLQAIFFEEQEGLLYLATGNSNIISIYKQVYSDQQVLGHSSSRLDDERNTKGEIDESDRMEMSGRLEEKPKPADNEIATKNVFEASLNELISHLQNSIQRTLKEKRKACILQWKARAYPETVVQAAKEIDNAKHDGKWEECLQKTNAIVELIQILPENEIPDKQELLVNIYSYFGPTLVEASNFSMVNEFDKKEWTNAIEKFLKTLPDDKYPYEAALLYFEMTTRVLASHESFKGRYLTAARKAKDRELQLYGAVLFLLAEWMTNNTDLGPVKQRDYFCRVAFEMDRSLQLAKYLDDKVAKKVIKKILQEVEVRRKSPFLEDIDSWMKRQLSKPTDHLWMENREAETFNLATGSSEETNNSGITTGQSLSFDHGEIIRKEDLEQVLSNHGKILKFGAASGVTSSKFYPGRVVIRIREGQLNHEYGHIFPPIIEGTTYYVMRGQYLIQSKSDNVFLRPGDSGSGVFYMDERKRLRCIGIAIGYLTSSYEAVVTPIEDVLEALGLDQNNLMRFPDLYIYQRDMRPYLS